MNRYIVKNCPSLDTDGITCQDCSFEDCGMEDCSNRNNCLTKELIEKIKDSQVEIGACSLVYTDDVLELFDIERCK